ncbi:thioredoxin-dependent thiol peroxidase [Gemmatimonas sp.]|uniref:thioredoxin-dependent thiol peroxidase n=1 Tax=Gemmatimonas sp. TaxID=1962908 RepID=UPI003F71AE67
MPIAAGQLAPDFTLPTDTGDTLTLSSLRGQWVVLYGYPKDDTSGCTTQACEFRDLFPRFDQKKAVILGISPDSVKSHVKFKTKYELPFTLVADEEKVALQAYDIWKEKSMYGKKYMGVERTTFVIDPTGQIVKVFEKVKPAGHAEEVMAVIG